MNCKGTMIALGVAALAALFFEQFPEFDLQFTAGFFDPATKSWWLNGPLDSWLRRTVSWTIGLIVMPAVMALVLKHLLPRRPMLVPGRAAVLMIITLALGPGLLTNTILKDNWARPRPYGMVQFGGEEQFFPWWDPRGTCDKNCSFIAGEPSGAFWTLAPAALAPPAWRAAAYGAALTFGAAVGFLRVAGGGHFVSDVVFAGIFTFLLIWLMHGLIYRWRPTRFEDAAVERFIEREAMRWRRALGWIVTRIRGAVPKS